ncbi:MAG: error-prone DNA polymerase [Bifidobacteriaceae bacterium]|jgi:error-prone DNA polymerase|nr:error-prone DNA polymerase [Bifidobacteriaceae bacterium]
MTDSVPSLAYAELHAHSAFSFLDGVSQPADLAYRGAELGLSALAITDHDGLYGVVQFANAAREVGLPTVYGAELTLDAGSEHPGVADPPGTHLLVLARGIDGYRRLSRAISEAYLAVGEKGPPRYDIDRLTELSGGQWVVLTGCRKGAVRRALAGSTTDGSASMALDVLVARFGRENVAVEITDTGQPGDGDMVDCLAHLADLAGLPVVATGNVHYATAREFPLATSLAAVRGRRSLDDMDGWLPAGATARLRSPAEMAARHRRHPDAVAAAVRIGTECAFDLRLVAPDLPPCDVPDGHTEASWLRELTRRGAVVRYGEPQDDNAKAWSIIDRELSIIDKLGFPGYFLIVHEIVEFCRVRRILCQGRGSAANSAVCFALGITAVDAVKYGLLFERFLAPERDGMPDIDLDIESGRREEVIQHVYERYGREHSALAGAVISYRPKMAIRDACKALGYDVGQTDAWSKQVERWGHLRDRAVHYTPWGKGDGQDTVADDDLQGIPDTVVDLAEQMMRLPRHMGIHPGGMVLCDRPVIEVCPVQWGRMENRSVLQWDRDDLADAGLVKFDLLGLGMLEAVRRAFDIIERAEGEQWEMYSIPTERPEVYDLLCAADTVGIFQVESRAQMATLPRLRPRKFYDLVVEVALIRPGPIQGRSVHPYIERARGRQPITYDSELLRPALERTLGVPLFQEQLMQLAIDAAGFTATQADQLRRAMGSKRSAEKMARLKRALMEGMGERGIGPEARDRIYDQLKAFADFGFPESHAFSFALIVYVSAWLKVFHPAAFYAAILASQPMGFYSPQSLVADARRHGVRVGRPDVTCSEPLASVERLVGDAIGRPHRLLRGDVALGVRLGLASVRGIGAKAAERIAAARSERAFESIGDLARRAELSSKALEALATAGALEAHEPDRRKALWIAGAAAEALDMLPGTQVGLHAPPLPAMGEVERSAADIWATGISVEAHPLAHQRADIAASGILSIAETLDERPGALLKVAGVVTHRQRPSTAKGVIFVSLEDETGLLNVVCRPDVWAMYRRTARTSPAVVVTGRLERSDGAANVVAARLDHLPIRFSVRSRDFH